MNEQIKEKILEKNIFFSKVKLGSFSLRKEYTAQKIGRQEAEDLAMVE